MITNAVEHRLTLQHILTHLLVNRNRVHGSVTFQRDILGGNTPLLGVLVHEVHQYLIVEILHAVCSDTQIIIIEIMCMGGIQDRITE